MAGPIMLAAGVVGIPLAVVEPNAFPGMSNRWVAPYVSAPSSPLRKRLRTSSPKRRGYRHSDSPRVFRNTTPPSRLNTQCTDLRRQSRLAEFESRSRRGVTQTGKLGKELRMVHQTGQTEYNAVREAYEKSPVPAEVLPYIENMPERFAAADVVVCRAGANTLAELAAAGKPAVLVPFPAAANQHQLRNAEALVRIGAARMILDRELNGGTFVQALSELRSNLAASEQMSRRIRSIARPNATDLIVDEMERMAGLATSE